MANEEELEKQLRLQKIENIRSLTNQLFLLGNKQYETFELADDKPVAYYDAMIEILNSQVSASKIGKPKSIKFDHIEQERAEMTKKEKKEFKKANKRQDKLVDSYLATIEPRASLKGRLAYNTSIILRYRGNKVGDQFAKDYPFGVLM